MFFTLTPQKMVEDISKYCKSGVHINDVDIFYFNARIIIAGASFTGKSQLCYDIVMKYSNKFSSIILTQTKTKSLLEDEVTLQNKLLIFSKIPSIPELSEISGRKLIIFDDNYNTALQNESTLNMFTYGRHYDLSIILNCQNLFSNNKYSRDVSLNATHFILMKQRDLNQIDVLARQLFGKSDSKKVVSVYKYIQKKYKFGHLLIDISQLSSENIELRSNIVHKNGPFETCYKFLE